jgi:hypothetical protein
VAARIRAGASGIALLALGLSLNACGGSQDGDVREVAEEFYLAVSEGNGQGACELLAPTTRSEVEQSSGEPCAAAIEKEVPADHGDSSVVEVFGTMAEVSFDDDTAFLTRMPGGWRVLAAGCRPGAEDRYDCAVKGA